MTRRYNHPKRQVDKARLERALIDARLNDRVSPIIDVTFIKLHEELAQWPDAPEGTIGWESVDKCGEGNNPHQWTLLSIARWIYSVKRSSGWETAGTTLVEAGDAVCVCGAIRSDIEQWLTNSSVQSLLYGLVHRDVQ